MDCTEQSLPVLGKHASPFAVLEEWKTKNAQVGTVKSDSKALPPSMLSKAPFSQPHFMFLSYITC